MNNPYTSTMEPIVDPKWKSQIAPQVVPARRESSEVREMTGFPPARDDLGLGSRLRGNDVESHGGELHLLQSFFAIEAQTLIISRAFSLALGRTNKSSSLETPLTLALVCKLVRYSFNNSRALPMR